MVAAEVTSTTRAGRCRRKARATAASPSSAQASQPQRPLAAAGPGRLHVDGHREDREARHQREVDRPGAAQPPGRPPGGARDRSDQRRGAHAGTVGHRGQAVIHPPGYGPRPSGVAPRRRASSHRRRQSPPVVGRRQPPSGLASVTTDLQLICQVEASMLQRLARAMYRRRRRVLVGWVLLLVGLVGLNATAGGQFADDFTLPGSESQQAADLLRASGFGDRAGANGQVVYRADQDVEDPGVRQAMTALFAELEAGIPDTEVVSPYTPQGSGQRSRRDPRIAYAQLNLGDRDSTE